MTVILWSKLAATECLVGTKSSKFYCMVITATPVSSDLAPHTTPPTLGSHPPITKYGERGTCVTQSSCTAAV